ncbi:hypothetical protein PybrP1_000291 [[Pythium] brassicae (nom. inval.)]|nr:hypothetical protein PybrP1_000291 [[Pythium] brassicae (nom. inval.)]
MIQDLLLVGANPLLINVRRYSREREEGRRCDGGLFQSISCRSPLSLSLSLSLCRLRELEERVVLHRRAAGLERLGRLEEPAARAQVELLVLHAVRVHDREDAVLQPLLRAHERRSPARRQWRTKTHHPLHHREPSDTRCSPHKLQLVALRHQLDTVGRVERKEGARRERVRGAALSAVAVEVHERAAAACDQHGVHVVAELELHWAALLEHLELHGEAALVAAHQVAAAQEHTHRDREKRVLVRGARVEPSGL